MEEREGDGSVRKEAEGWKGGQGKIRGNRKGE